MKSLPEIILTEGGIQSETASCPNVTIDGWRVPCLRKVEVTAPFNDVAEVTITIVAKVKYG